MGCMCATSVFASDITSEILGYYGCPNLVQDCKSLTSNIANDRNGCRVKPQHLGLLRNQININKGKLPINVSGKMNHFGPISGKYAYTYSQLGSGKLLITAKIFFSNLNKYSSRDIASYQSKITKAERIWNQYNPFKNKYVFQFLITNVKDRNNVAPKLVKNYTRGPYFTEWSLQWNEYTIAHEFGHVLGLKDEYEYFDNKDESDNCTPGSIMCNSQWGAPLGHHYQLILQRPFCEV